MLTITMTERVGSQEARLLYNSNSNEEWEIAYSSYSSAVAAVAKNKNKNNLVNWDDFLYNQFPLLIKQRSPMHFTSEELSTVMKWKLSRGKARPLQKLVDSNSPASVFTVSKKSLNSLLVESDWEKAITEVTALKGIGVATATAIFAALAPSVCPFMADEVIEAASMKRDYTMKVYKSLRLSLLAKAEELRSMDGNTREWSAEDVGKALWTKAMTAVYPNETIINNSITQGADKKRKTDSNDNKAGQKRVKKKK